MELVKCFLPTADRFKQQQISQIFLHLEFFKSCFFSKFLSCSAFFFSAVKVTRNKEGKPDTLLTSPMYNL